MREYDAFIDGKHVRGRDGTLVETINPTTGAAVALVARTSRRDARRAIDAARRAAGDGVWRAASPSDRAVVLRAVADLLWERQAEIADLEVEECGTPIRIALRVVEDAVELMRRIASETADALTHDDATPAVGRIRRTREPLGVLTAILPDGAPFLRAIEVLAPALVAGNAVVLQPPPTCPSSVLEIARAISESDMPAGTVNVLPGALPEVADELVTNPLVDRALFRGPAGAAQRLVEAAARAGVPLVVEIESTCPAFVSADADLDLAVPGVLWGALLLSGRTGRATSRVLVDAAIAEPVLHHLTRGAAALRTGDPSSFDTDLGPLGTGAEATATERAILRAIAAGAEVPPGHGRRADATSAFVRPAVVGNVRSSMAIAHEDVRGPLVIVVPVAGEDEAVALANRGRPPAAAIWTRDPERGAALADRLRAHAVWVNEYHPLAGGVPAAVAPSGAGYDPTRVTDAGRERRVWVDGRASVRNRPWTELLGLGRVFGIDP